MRTDVDILFVNPGDRREIYQDLGDEFCAIEPPVLAGLFATHARRLGLSCAILDVPAEALSAGQAAGRIDQMNPALVALVVCGSQPSASTQNMTAAGAIAALTKSAGPSRKILMTGTHPSALPERTLGEEAVDFVVQGEGPATIARTALAIKDDERDFSKIPSLWWKDDHGRLVPPSTSEPLLHDLDREMPGVAWDLLEMRRYRAHNWHAFDDIDARTPYAAIHTTLGCPYRCQFCCINAPFGGPSYRRWSPDQVVTEIDQLVTRAGVRHLKIADEMFVLHPRHVLDICDRLIARRYGLNIWAYARVDTVKDEYLDRLKAAGVNWLCLGIESANSTVRDGAAKSLSDEMIVDVCDRIRRHGIHVLANYIFGLPDDTPARMQETLDLALAINAEFANFYCAMAYPGSPLYADALARGAALPARWQDYAQHGYDALPLANPHATAAEILEFRDRAWQTYFARPAYLAMIERTFGRRVVDHIARMRAVPLRRRLLDERLAS